MIGTHDPGPTVGVSGLEEVDRRRHRQDGAGVVGSHPVEQQVETRAVGAVGVGPVRYDRRDDPVVAVGPDPQEAGALGSAQPLVAVAGVVGGSQAIEIDRDLARTVGAVDQGVYPALLQFGDDVGDGEHQGGRAGDVVDESESGAVGHGRRDGCRDLLRIGEGEGDAGDDDLDPGPPGDEVDGVATGVVGMVGDEQLVTGGEGEGTEHGVDAGGGVGDEDQVVGSGTEEPAQAGAGRVQQLLQVPLEEAHRVGLHAAPDTVLGGEDGLGRGAEGPVVEEVVVRIEDPVHYTRAARVSNSRSMSAPSL